jgi:hypothetical protein
VWLEGVAERHVCTRRPGRCGCKDVLEGKAASLFWKAWLKGLAERLGWKVWLEGVAERLGCEACLEGVAARRGWKVWQGVAAGRCDLTLRRGGDMISGVGSS